MLPGSVGLTLRVFLLVSVGERSLGIIVVDIAIWRSEGSSMTLHFGSNFVHTSYVFQLFLKVISKQPVSKRHMFIVNMRQQ